MTRWTIRVDYTTGDTFSSYEGSEELGISWENLDKAKEALDRISELTEAIRQNEFFYNRKKGIDLTTLKGHIPGSPYSITLPLDDGSEQKHYMFWIGYFETLNALEITSVDEPGMKWLRH